MKTILAIIFAMAGLAEAAISTATKPHTIDSAATPKVSYVDDNDEALLDKLNEVIDTTNAYLGGGVSASVLSTMGDQRLTIDSDNNGSNRWFVTSGGTSDTLLRILEGGAWATYGAGTGTKLTLSDSILAATARISGLTASRLMSTNAGSTLASVADLTSWIAGTSNQITSTSDGDGSLTLSIPNSFTLPSASPTFTGLTLTGNQTIGGTLGVTGVSKLGNGTLTFASKNFSVIGASFDGTAVQFENTDVNTVANGRVFNFGITDVSGTNGRFDLTQPGERTILSVFSNGNVGIGSTTDGGEGFQVAGTSRFAGAATFATNFTQSAGTHTVSVTDNTANAVDIQEGSNNYINLTTANGAEVLAFGNATTNPAIQLLGTGTKTIDGTINTDLTPSRTVITDGIGNLAVNTETGTGSHMRAGSPTTTGTLTGAAANFSGAVTASQITLGGGEAFVYGDTSFTVTGTGFSGSVTATCYGVKIGRSVTIHIIGLTGTSNATTFTITGIPAGWQPANLATFLILASDASTETIAIAQISGGTITLSKGVPGGAWTNSGTKAIFDSPITYQLQ